MRYLVKKDRYAHAKYKGRLKETLFYINQFYKDEIRFINKKLIRRDKIS